MMVLRAKRVRTRSKQGVRAYLTGTGPVPLSFRPPARINWGARPYILERTVSYAGAPAQNRILNNNNNAIR